MSLPVLEHFCDRGVLGTKSNPAGEINANTREYLPAVAKNRCGTRACRESSKIELPMHAPRCGNQRVDLALVHEGE